jgi:hypothetical protein
VQLPTITESYAPPRFKVARSALTIADGIANPMFCAVVESLEVSRSPGVGRVSLRLPVPSHSEGDGLASDLTHLIAIAQRREY